MARETMVVPVVARRPKSPHPQIKQANKQTILINLGANLLVEMGANVLPFSNGIGDNGSIAVVSNDN